MHKWLDDVSTQWDWIVRRKCNNNNNKQQYEQNGQSDQREKWRMKIVSAVRCECMWNGNHNLAPNENIILQKKKITLDFPSAYIHVAIEISRWTIVRVLVHHSLVAPFIFVSLNFSFCEFIQNCVRRQLKANAIHFEAIYSKHDVCIGMPSIVRNCMHLRTGTRYTFQQTVHPSTIPLHDSVEPNWLRQLMSLLCTANVCAYISR